MSNRGDLTTSAVDAPAERIIARVRRQGRVLFWPSVILILAAGAAGYFAWNLPESWMQTAVWGGLAAVFVIVWFLPFLWWLGQRTTITDRRAIVRRGFFIRERTEVTWTRVYDVSIRRSWIQSIFRSGDVLVNTGSENPLVLRDLPRAGLVQRAIHELADSAHQTNVPVRWQDSSSTLADETLAWGGR